MAELCLVQNTSEGGPPCDAAKLGHETKGSGDHWCVVAHTQWGNIPGKANGNSSCWYPYGGKEYRTNDFSWIVTNSTLVKVKNTDTMPAGALRLGYQIDGQGLLYVAVAKTEHGEVPGKAKNGTCWYPFGGKEHRTTEFSWVIRACSHALEEIPTDVPMVDVMTAGFQNDKDGYLCIALANTTWGSIPGRATEKTCWFAHGGNEKNTTDFKWLRCRKSLQYIHNSKCTGGSPPQRALRCGYETGGTGQLYLALAITENGAVPGKACKNSCWYSYYGKQHVTKDFLWVLKSSSHRSRYMVPSEASDSDSD